MEGINVMKILVISNMYPNEKYPSFGIFVRNFCKQLDLLNIDYDKLVICKTNSRILKVFKYFIHYICVFFTILLKKYDLIYVHYASHNALPVLMARKLKRFDLIVNCHGSDVVPQNSKQEKLQKNVTRIVHIANKIVVPSEYFQNLISDKYKISKGKIYIYPSAGLDKKIFYKYSQEERSESLKYFNLSSDFKYIGFVSRIDYGKGWDIFVKAISKIKNNNSYKFIIVGTGNYKEELHTFIKNHQIEDKIILFDILEQHDLAKMYNCFEYFCFPTILKESLGLVGLEAMACGIPNIASDYAALKYYVKDSVNGYTFKVNDENELAKKLIKAMNINFENYDIMVNNCLNTAKEYYSDNVICILKQKILND